MNPVLLLFFILALIGYYLAYKRYLCENAAFFPLIVIAGSAVTAYLFGLVGLLTIGALIPVVAGCCMIPVSLIRLNMTSRNELFRKLLDPVLIVLLIGAIWSYVITRNIGISHPDDFSHWYKICKAMYADNSYPTTPEIRFITYPPATATWIYLFTRVVGFSVPNCMWGQSLINLAACCSLFSAIPNKTTKLVKTLMCVCVCGTSTLLCSIDISTYSLLVDCTLGLIALSCALFFFSFDFALDKKTFPILIILITFLDLTKFSGLLFELFLLIFLISESKRAKEEKYKLKTLALFSVPVVLTVLYRVRNTAIYPNINTSKQAASIERFLSCFNDKTPESVGDIVFRVFVEAFGPVGGFSQVSIIWIGLLTVFMVVIIQSRSSRKEKNKPDFRKLIKYVFGVYLIYVVFLAFTYVFSMNELEAESLECFYRYVGTVAVYIIGLICYMLMKLSACGEKKKFIMKLSAFIVLTIVSGHLLFGYNYLFEGKQQYSPNEFFTDDTPWESLDEYADENMEYTEDSYLIIWDDNYLQGSNYYMFQVKNLAGAFFRSNHIECILMSEMDENAELTAEYDHIVVVGNLNESIDNI